MTHEPLKPREMIFAIGNEFHADQFAWKDDEGKFHWWYTLTDPTEFVDMVDFNEFELFNWLRLSFPPKNIHRFYIEVE